MFLSLRVMCYTMILNICSSTDTDFFAATAELEYLLDTRARTIDDLDIYIDNEEKKLSVVKKLHTLYREGHEKAKEDIVNYSENPINAFIIIKQLTIDLCHLRDIIKTGTELINQITTNRDDVNYPTLQDVKGASQALIRLQKLYKLDVQQLARGNLNGFENGISMTASDLYTLGHVLYNAWDFYNARNWFIEAFRKYDKEDIPYKFDKRNIFEDIVASCYLGNRKNATQWIKRIFVSKLKMNETMKIVVSYLRKNIRSKGKQDLLDISELTEDNKKLLMPSDAQLRDKLFAAICRGESNSSIKMDGRLKCRYLSENHSFLKIAPIKMELIHLNPDIVLCYDVIGDEEIKTLQQMARPILKRTPVRGRYGESRISDFRISKAAEFNDTTSETIARISRCVSHMTGLSVETAEPLQIINYGIGGHFRQHYDCIVQPNCTKNCPVRIATVLFYMSDVAQGGATVFIKLGLTVRPVKRAALFWHNLLPSGELDPSTMHGACPVLQGSKWVSNKWIGQSGQELIKPCSLEDQKRVDTHT
ncbi:prolyl 4-hydroxylase subunit alpha-1-like [Anticarsia gemmatalis]|uniref:prolyl 4-hydroxylase subunit alpha-1-like n=1 Tax=Anticarsia gemmatalis TaxID=129554 RepID=UPI003F77416A